MLNLLAAFRYVGIGRLNLSRCLRLHSSWIQESPRAPTLREKCLLLMIFCLQQPARGGFGGSKAPYGEGVLE